MCGEPLLPKDTDVSRPEFIVLKASAGTGKTHALTLRFAQFLLSDKIRNNQLNQILAITFTHNAANEMKARIIGWLKDTYFGQDTSRMTQIKELVSLSEEALPGRAESVLSHLFDHYTDFQVTTIDSFMTDVFKASAIELGFSPDFEITLNTTPVISYAFSRYLRNITAESKDGQLLLNISDSLREMRGSDKAFIWDPSDEILQTFTEFYRKIEALYRQPEIKDLKEAEQELRTAERGWHDCLERLRQLMENSCLERSGRSAIANRLNSKNIKDWFNCSFKTLPVKKPKSPDLYIIYEQILQCVEDLEKKLNQYKKLYASYYFQPHLQVYHQLLENLDCIKKEKGLIFIDDINRHLADYLSTGVVPDIYLCLGGQIYHFLIDEFQDTSPIQWRNLTPLIDNALSQGGSLFIVGDTKQAIYGFREADYEIMVKYEKGKRKFQSVETSVKDLEANRRSQKAILDFVSLIFPNGVKRLSLDQNNKKIAREKITAWQEAASSSGLDDFICEGPGKKEEDSGQAFPGYVEMEFFRAENETDNNDEEEADGLGEKPRPEPEPAGEDGSLENSPLKKRIQELVLELHDRGYDYSDITILTYKNETVAEAASWLNEKSIPFITFSSLDIRKRQIIREIMALIQFLDFPLDNLSFSTFLLGQVFQNKLKLDNQENEEEIEKSQWAEFVLEARLRSGKKVFPLYTHFRQKYPELWGLYFEPLFKKAGYLPLYDLVSQIYRTFSVFKLSLAQDEQSALIKLLEVIKKFEGQGRSNLRDFVQFSEAETEDNSVWTVDVPEGIPAVKIMTIHKAKGLGFPVVILLLYPEYDQWPLFYLKKEEDSGQGPVRTEVLKLVKDIVSTDEELKQIYEESNRRELVNRLNTFYVALTRAAEELYILGQRGKRRAFPFDFLEAINFSPDNKYQSAGEKPARPARKKASHRRGQKKRANSSLVFYYQEQDKSRPVKNRLHYREERRGELIHTILEKINFLEDNLEEQLNSIISLPEFRNYHLDEREEAKNCLRQCLTRLEVAEFFRHKPGREVRTEAEIVNRQGELYRTDRLIIEPEVISIVDFKTGQFPDQTIKKGHADQLNNYKVILEEIYPGRKVRGWLLYIDSGELEEVL